MLPAWLPCKHDCPLPGSWHKVGPMTSTLLSRGGTSPRTILPVPHDQTSSMDPEFVGFQ